MKSERRDKDGVGVKDLNIKERERSEDRIEKSQPISRGDESDAKSNDINLIYVFLTDYVGEKKHE